MKSSQLLHSFDQAIGWNAFLYGLYKFLTTLLTLILYAKLNTQDFSIYANVHSIIFILLLWLDFGFKKSIARFCPEYAQSDRALRNFILRILCFKIILLVCAIPLCQYALNTFIPANLSANIVYLATGIFVAEGLSSLLQLIYQAHFWHKYFSLLSSIILTAQTVFTCLAACSLSQSSTLLSITMYSKIIGGTCMCIASCGLLVWLYMQQKKKAEEVHLSTTHLDWLFIKHSGIMWASNNLKSLTERNVIIPVLTHTLGSAHANLFKVANDSALFFYRIILKTIGSTDTALLSYAKKHKIGLEDTLNYLQRKVTFLTGGLFSLFLVLLAVKYHSQIDPAITQLSAFITICYLAEILLSPYERILEVEQKYQTLFKAYVPYIILLMPLLHTRVMCSLGLFSTIALIHIARLISAGLIVYFAKKEYYRTYDLKEVSAKNVG